LITNVSIERSGVSPQGKTSSGSLCGEDQPIKQQQLAPKKSRVKISKSLFLSLCFRIILTWWASQQIHPEFYPAGLHRSFLDENWFPHQIIKDILQKIIGVFKTTLIR